MSCFVRQSIWKSWLRKQDGEIDWKEEAKNFPRFGRETDFLHKGQEEKRHEFQYLLQ